MGMDIDGICHPAFGASPTHNAHCGITVCPVAGIGRMDAFFAKGPAMPTPVICTGIVPPPRGDAPPAAGSPGCGFAWGARCFDTRKAYRIAPIAVIAGPVWPHWLTEWME